MTVVQRLNIREGELFDGKYTIDKAIGAGSYGDVFVVTDAHRRRMAMKVLRLWDVPGDVRESLVRRFEREYKAGQLPSDYLIHTLDFGVSEGNPYFVMEYCERGDLSTLIGHDKQQLPQMVGDVLRGLHFLHSAGKVHRDLKPENVLLRSDGKAALTDFGVLGDRKASISDKNIIGRPKDIFGSPLYMAPEIASRKGGGVTYLPTVDIWSLGVMIYELVTDGQFPFGNITPESDIGILEPYQQKAKQGLWNRQQLRSCLHGRQWETIVGRCLQPDYRDRYQSATDMLHDLTMLFSVDIVDNVIEEERRSRTSSITRLIVTQGENLGEVYLLDHCLKGAARMLKVGRSRDNDITLPESSDTYLSRHHFTLERAATGHYWSLRDGQWSREEHSWQASTNGTYLNATPVPLAAPGLRLFTGDIITAGEYKLKIE